jgi:hypothetical protein
MAIGWSWLYFKDDNRLELAVVKMAIVWSWLCCKDGSRMEVAVLQR